MKAACTLPAKQHASSAGASARASFGARIVSEVLVTAQQAQKKKGLQLVWSAAEVGDILGRMCSCFAYLVAFNIAHSLIPPAFLLSKRQSAWLTREEPARRHWACKTKRLMLSHR